MNAAGHDGLPGIRGHYSDGHSSASFEARLDCSGGDLVLQWRERGQEQQQHYALDTVEISSRLGNTPRQLGLPDGGRFETRDNDAVDALLRMHAPRRGGRWLHAIESHLGYVLPAAVVVFLCGWLLLRHGLPAAADHVARQLPVSVSASIGEQTFGYLEQQFLQPSALPQDTRKRLTQRFQDILVGTHPGYHYQLAFRAGGPLGANALALPSGTIIMTDELVALARHDDELVAILAHEIGHVEHRHGLRQVLQYSALGLIITYATGDVSSLVVALPAILVQLGYSREFEREADCYAVNYLRRAGIPPARLADILIRLEQQRDTDGGGRLARYLSTHPGSTERSAAMARDC